RQGGLDGVQVEFAVHVLAVQRRGVCKAADSVQNIQKLHQGGAGIPLQLGAVQGVAQGGQRLLVPVPQLVVPVEHHEHAGHAAAPLAGLLDGLEIGEDGEGVVGLHVVEVRVSKVDGDRKSVV